MTRPMTRTEKILARASGRNEVSPGDIVVVEVDQAVLLDMQFSSPTIAWQEPLRISDPSKLALVFDHAIPATSERDANGMVKGRAFAKRFSIKQFADVGGHGISHQVIAERGLARPGELLLCSDSHTCAAGAFNCAARGVGGLEMLQVACTGSTWFIVSPTIRVELTGELGPDVEGKDVFLALSGKYGSADNCNLEFYGSGVAGMSLHDRRTIATQCAEVNAEFAIFPGDDVVMNYLRERGQTEFSPVEPDEGAEFADTWQLDLTGLEPQVATPGSVLKEHVKQITELAGTKLDQCFVGSCANGHLEDFALAAEMLKGRSVAAGVRLIVTPSSQEVYREAARAGYVATIAEAGGVVTNSTCGACFGYHMGVLGDGEVCLTASTRNFRGRMGSPNAEVYMASTRSVIASAITGFITDPREVHDKETAEA